MRSLPAATIVLDDLVIASPQKQGQGSREPLASGAVRGKMSAFWKLAAKATAVYLGAQGSSHSCPTSLAKLIFSIFDAFPVPPPTVFWGEGGGQLPPPPLIQGVVCGGATFVP